MLVYVLLAAIALEVTRQGIVLNRLRRKQMADTSKLTAITTKLQTDVAALLASSANDQPAIDAAVATLTTVDNAVVAATPAPAPTV